MLALEHQQDIPRFHRRWTYRCTENTLPTPEFATSKPAVFDAFHVEEAAAAAAAEEGEKTPAAASAMGGFEDNFGPAHKTESNNNSSVVLHADGGDDDVANLDDLEGFSEVEDN